MARGFSGIAWPRTLFVHRPWWAHGVEASPAALDRFGEPIHEVPPGPPRICGIHGRRTLATMRFLHTADWHLGRIFGGFDMLPIQQHALDGLVAIARQTGPQAIVVAGDVYDRAVPPEDAVHLLDDVLARLAELAPVLLIAGNHDSGRRLEFGRGFLRGAGVHVAGTAGTGVTRVDLGDDHGVVAFHLLPYATPEEARYGLGRDDLRSHDDATRARVATCELSGTSRHVLVGHMFVQGGQETKDSERDISVGGIATVDPGVFGGFAYTALGHLHRPHSIGNGRIRYSGSLAPYSFSEEDHAKGVSVVEIDAAGGVLVEEIRLPQKHGMRTLRGTIEELCAAALQDDRRDHDLVRVLATDLVLPPGSSETLRKLYPHLLEFGRDRPSEQPAKGAAGDPEPQPPPRSEREFLESFLSSRYPNAVDAAVLDFARECLEQAIRRQGGEA